LWFIIIQSPRELKNEFKIKTTEVRTMRNNMTTEMMNYCRNALSFLAGVDNATMRDVAVMNMRSRFDASQQSMSEVADSICGERAEANEDFSF
jgi:hypothetical protein